MAYHGLSWLVALCNRWNPMESSQDTSITWFKTSVVDTKFTMMSTVEASDPGAALDRNAANAATFATRDSTIRPS